MEPFQSFMNGFGLGAIIGACLFGIGAKLSMIEIKYVPYWFFVIYILIASLSWYLLFIS
jgi:hypothetical protein